jgi:hypothetical protein
MRIGIIGTGNVGSTLGKGWAAKGHAVVFGVRNTGDAKVQAAVKAAGGATRAATVKDAAADAEVVVLATPWGATQHDATGFRCSTSFQRSVAIALPSCCRTLYAPTQTCQGGAERDLAGMACVGRGERTPLHVQVSPRRTTRTTHPRLTCRRPGQPYPSSVSHRRKRRKHA